MNGRSYIRITRAWVSKMEQSRQLLLKLYSGVAAIFPIFPFPIKYNTMDIVVYGYQSAVRYDILG